VQPAAIKRLGVLSATAESDPVLMNRYKLLRQGLQELGWTEGRILYIEYRLNEAAFAGLRSGRGGCLLSERIVGFPKPNPSDRRFFDA
jgi:hypothetical protein